MKDDRRGRRPLASTSPSDTSVPVLPTGVYWKPAAVVVTRPCWSLSSRAGPGRAGPGRVGLTARARRQPQYGYSSKRSGGSRCQRPQLYRRYEAIIISKTTTPNCRVSITVTSAVNTGAYSFDHVVSSYDPALNYREYCFVSFFDTVSVDKEFNYCWDILSAIAVDRLTLILNITYVNFISPIIKNKDV